MGTGATVGETGTIEGALVPPAAVGALEGAREVTLAAVGCELGASVIAVLLSIVGAKVMDGD